jgi:hypothetical protein
MLDLGIESALAAVGATPRLAETVNAVNGRSS